MAKRKTEYEIIDGVKYELKNGRRYSVVEGKRYRIIGSVSDVMYHGVIGHNGEEISCEWDDGIPPEERNRKVNREGIGIDFLEGDVA